MKKLLLAICALFVLSIPVTAGAACSLEEFQKLMTDMQTSMSELAKAPDRMTKVNDALQKEFQDELMELAKFTQEAVADPAKAQVMLDKGCDIYTRINQRIKEIK